jgi:RNA polymerase sigma factor (sigma-70 family)
MPTWWIGPAIGAAGLVFAWLRGRVANQRLAEANKRLDEANEGLSEASMRLERMEGMLADTLARLPLLEPSSEEAASDLGLDLGLDIATPQQRRALGEAIARLPEREKLVVALHYYEKLSDREIADVIGAPVNTVHQVRFRALQRLRRELGGESGDKG